VHVTVQQDRRLEVSDEAVIAAEPAVRRILSVADAQRRRVGEQDINWPAIAQAAPPDAVAQQAGAPGLLPVGVLVRPCAVAQATAEPSHPQPSSVDDAAVGAESP
jgi:hypothetical protein